MKKRILSLTFLALTVAFTTVSCSEDDGFNVEQSKNSVLTLSFSGENILTYKALTVQAIEINTGKQIIQEIANTNAFSLELPRGSYKISVAGEVTTREGEDIQVASTSNVDIQNNVENITIQLYAKQFSEDFIIEEVFFVGVKTPEGKAYNSGRYFKIINNTDKVLYADQLLILQSQFLSSVDNNVTPYQKEQYLPVKGVMMIPGTGTDHPVEPGDFIVIADNAINHNALNSNAFDLSKANFEFPNLTNAALGNVDNPAVPNMEYIYGGAIFLHNSGVEAYALARFPEGENATTFLTNHKYDYSYIAATGREMSFSSYKIPNDWIVDGQNNANADKFMQFITSSSIDIGYTGIGSSYQNADRFGKSVRRKVIGQSANGKNVYKDTNNSSDDFIRNAEPSLKNGITH